MKKENGIPFVVSYNPAFRNLSTLLRKNFSSLYSDEEVSKVYLSQSLKSFFVITKVYPLKGTVDSSKCDSKRCRVCLNISETDIFESFQTKKQYKINHHLNCTDKCLICLLSRKTCGLPYVFPLRIDFDYGRITIKTMKGNHSVVKSTCNQLNIFIFIMGFYKIAV